MTRISTLASWLFFPLFMPMYAVVFTMFYPSMEYGRDGVPLDRLSPELQGLLLLILFIFIVLGPVFSVLSLSKSALITGIELEDKKDRPIPIALVFVYSTSRQYGNLLRVPVAHFHTFQIIASHGLSAAIFPLLDVDFSIQQEE